MYVFLKKKTLSEEEWNLIESSDGSTIFQTRKWSRYLDAIGYRTFIVEIKEASCSLGYFIGVRIWRGIWIVAAPFEGIGTYTMGLVSIVQMSAEKRIDIYKSLAAWILENRMASMVQVDDWQLRKDSKEWIPTDLWHHEALDAAGIHYSVRPTLYVNLKSSEEELWNGLHYKSAKYSVNKARKNGLHIRVIDKYEDISSFTKIHYQQLKEVCNRKGVSPKASQKESRMRALCEALFPDRVVMLEVFGPDENGVEQIMSTAIFGIDKGECIYWTGASYQIYQKYCPNELMVWEAMRILHDRNCGDLNFGGMASYKLKFGTIYAYVPKLVFAKHQWIVSSKEYAKEVYFVVRNKVGKLLYRK